MLTLLERQIIFGDLLESIKDISVLNEVQQKSAIEGETTGSADENIKNKAAARLSQEQINAFHKKLSQRDQKLKNDEEHNIIQKDKSENTKINANANELKAKTNYRKLMSGVIQTHSEPTPSPAIGLAASANITTNNPIITEDDKIDSRISADKRAEKRAYKNLQWSKYDRGDLDAYNKSLTRNFDTRNNVVMKQFDTILFKGIGGLALKKMLGQQLTDSEEENIECRVVAEVMSSDTVSKTIVNNIKLTLNKFKSGTAKDEDRTRLAMFRSQFKIQYQKMKELYNEKVGE